MVRTLNIQNLGPIEDMTLDLTARMTVLHGPHGSGKSTVANALTLALYSETGRVALKRDLYQMIRAGADKASIVWRDGNNQMRRTLTSSGSRGSKTTATEIDRVRMRYPWEALAQKPSAWRDMLGETRLPGDKLLEILADLPIAREAVERAGASVAETIAIFEDWRLDLHHEIQKPPALPERVRVSGSDAEIYVPEYLPHKAHYEKELATLEIRDREDRREYERKAAAFASQQAAVDTNLKHLREFAAFLHLEATPSAEEIEAIRAKAQESVGSWRTVADDKTKALADMPEAVCDKCGQPWESPERRATREAQEEAERSMGVAASTVGLCGTALKALQTLTVALTAPDEPEDLTGQIRGIREVLQAIRAYEIVQAARIASETKNVEVKATRKQVQTAIEKLRDPQVTAHLAGTTKISRIRDALRASCEMLGLPQVELLDDLTPALRLSDGSARTTNLLSDTQRALAGLALSEAFARAEGVDTLVVDQVDWVHGAEYTQGLCQYLQEVSRHYSLILVLTASPAMTEALAKIAGGYVLTAGQVKSSWPAPGA